MNSHNHWNRRNFLKSASAATLATLASNSPREAFGNAPIDSPPALADTMIVLWMGGGMAHTETFDPKRYTPYEKGLGSDQVLSTFPAIDTCVDNIKLSEGLEKIGSVMDRGTLIRSYKAGDLGFILHSRHQFQWHTGYAPPLTVSAPHIGAWVAKVLGPNNPDVPAFIDIGQRLDVGEGEELKAFHQAGFFGSEYGPFMIPYPEDAMKRVQPPEGMAPSRFQNREKLFRKLMENSPIGEFGSSYHKESLARSMDKAHRLLNSPASKAFDLSLEPKESYEKYNTGRFGLGCLLARRLTEVGARFIEVTTEYVPFEGWDTHENGHSRLVGMKELIDGPVSQLVLDLEEKGLLDRTLIVLASEFSRDMLVEGKPDLIVKGQVEQPDVIEEEKFYGMHRHFTDAGSVLLFGGGIKKGYLHGVTAEERPCKTLEGEIRIEELHASLYTSMGISPMHKFEIEQRPFYATKDGKGKAVKELFG